MLESVSELSQVAKNARSQHSALRQEFEFLRNRPALLARECKKPEPSEQAIDLSVYGSLRITEAVDSTAFPIERDGIFDGDLGDHPNAAIDNHFKSGHTETA